MAKKKAPAEPAPKPAPKSTAGAQPPAAIENAEEMAEPKELSSSMVATIAYSEGEMEVLFQSGSEENYKVSEAEFKELKDAPSPGKWLWAHFAPHPVGVR